MRWVMLARGLSLLVFSAGKGAFWFVKGLQVDVTDQTESRWQSVRLGWGLIDDVGGLFL
jgi:hypothetical protein